VSGLEEFARDGTALLSGGASDEDEVLSDAHDVAYS
jgi:hypothetical protein